MSTTTTGPHSRSASPQKNHTAEKRPRPTSFRSLEAILHVHRTLSARRARTLKKPAATVFQSITDPNASRSSQPAVHIKGLPLQNPHVASLTPEGEIKPADTRQTNHLLPPPGFVLGGEAKVLGDLPAKVYKIITGEHTGGASESGVKELVHIERDVKLKELLRGLEGTRLGDLVLRNPKMKYQHAVKEAEEEAGVWFSAGVPLEGKLWEMAGEVLRDVLGVENAEIAVKGFVGKERDWKKPLAPKRLHLAGTFAAKPAVDAKRIAFTKIGIEIEGIRRDEGILHRKAKAGYDVRMSFFGDVAMPMPGSKLPLMLGWTMKREKSDVWTFRIGKTGDELTDIFGFKGLRLSDVAMTADFPIGTKVEKFVLRTKASLAFAKGTLNVEGAYEAGDFFVQASVPQCTLNDIRDLYTSMTGRKLEPFSHTVDFKDLKLRIDTKGLNFLGQVTVNGHRSVNANLEVKRDGLSLKGALEDIQYGDTTVEKAQLDVFIGRKSKNETSRESGFAVTGTVTFHHLELDVAVYTTFDHSGGVQWTVYGELEGTNMKLNRLASDVKDTWLDLELRQVAFIASNMDSPPGSYNVFNYPIVKGVQFCAAIDRIEPLDHLTRAKADGLVLRAAWSPDRGFAFEAILPSPIGIQLTKTISTGPVTVGIVASKIPELVFTASLNVTPPGQDHPLVFTFGLKADVVGAKGFGQVKNYWVNPFGISEHVKVGPDIALEVGIVYAVLAATGTPSSIGFSGGMAIGDVEAQMAMAVSENPTDQLIKASLTELSVTDLTKFASKVSRQDIPLPPEDLLAFRNVLIYLSSGTSIGTTYYPAAATMKGQVELFSKKTELECTIGSTTRINAKFDELRIGPLAVTGTKPDTGPQTVVELGLSKQHILIDGCVRIFDLEASLHAQFDILPQPSMAFDLRLNFADALRMSLSAELVGLVDWKNLDQADFMIHAVLEQDILDYLVQQIRRFFEAVYKFFKNGIEAAHEFIDAAEESIESTVVAAKEAFEEAKKAWEEKERTIFEALSEIKEEFNEGIQILQDELLGAEKEAEDAVSCAHAELQQAKLEKSAAVRAASAEVLIKKKELDTEVRNRLQEIRELKEKTKIHFGEVEEQARKAALEVQNAQSWYDECNRKHKAAQDQLDRAHFFRKIDIWIKVSHSKGHLDDAEAKLNVAKAAHEAVKAHLEDPEFLELRQAKAEKKEELRAVRQAKEAQVAAAEKQLQDNVDAETAVVRYHEAKVLKEQVTGAQATLVEKKKAIEEFEKTKGTRVKDLEQQAEKLEQTEEFAKLKEAEKQLVRRRTTMVDTSAAKKAVEAVAQKDTDEKKMGTVERIVDGIDEVFNIERVELHGSLRALVTEGKPLTAKVNVCIAGKKMELVLDYGLGDAMGLVGSLWEQVWDDIRDVFDGDDEEESGKEVEAKET